MRRVHSSDHCCMEIPHATGGRVAGAMIAFRTFLGENPGAAGWLGLSPRSPDGGIEL